MTKKKESLNIDELLKRILMVTSIITLITISYKVLDFKEQYRFEVDTTISEDSRIENFELYPETIPLREEGKIVGYQTSMFDKKDGIKYVRNEYLDLDRKPNPEYFTNRFR